MRTGFISRKATRTMRAPIRRLRQTVMRHRLHRQSRGTQRNTNVKRRNVQPDAHLLHWGGVGCSFLYRRPVTRYLRYREGKRSPSHQNDSQRGILREAVTEDHQQNKQLRRKWFQNPARTMLIRQFTAPDIADLHRYAITQ